jgi:hypothetical protein
MLECQDVKVSVRDRYGDSMRPWFNRAKELHVLIEGLPGSIESNSCIVIQEGRPIASVIRRGRPPSSQDRMVVYTVVAISDNSGGGPLGYLREGVPNVGYLGHPEILARIG